MPKTLLIIFVTAVVLIASTFFYKAVTFLDPDFGWHIRLGELTSVNGAYKSDPFSYTMPTFSYIDHEWLTNILMFKTMGNGQKVFPSIFLLLITFASFLITLQVVPWKKQTPVLNYLITTFLFVFWAGSLIPFFGIRPQVVSWFFFSLLLMSVGFSNSEKKYYFLIPILTLIWVNMHGSFALVPVTLFIHFVFKYLRTKEFHLGELVVFLVCILITGINPYGFRVWEEVLRSATDSSLRSNVLEWRPAYFSLNMFYVFFVALFAGLFTKIKKTISLETLAVSTFFFVQSVFSLRHIPLWVLTALPIFYLTITRTYEESKKIKYGVERFQKVLTFGICGALVLYILYNLISYLSPGKKLREGSFYPTQAIAFVKNNPSSGEIFTTYDWGGYFIWKLPEKKVFIDGRMPSWKRKSSPESESLNAMEEYKNIYLGEVDAALIFEKYDVDTVVLPKAGSKNLFEKAENLVHKLLKSDDPKNNKSLLEQVGDLGWQKIYEDDAVYIYRKTL